MKRKIDYKEMYDRGWTEPSQKGREDFGDRELAHLFLKKVDILRRDDRILEVGCALGKLSDELYHMGYTNIVGVDIAPSKITLAKERFPHLDLRCMDAAVLEFADGIFDVCLSFDVVEHLPNVDVHLREALRVLKPSGTYLLQTPNALSNAVWETIAKRGLRWRLVHPSLQSHWGLRRKLVQAGFTDVQFIKVPPLSNYKISRLPRWLRWVFRSIPWARLPLSLQIGLYVIARKPGSAD